MNFVVVLIFVNYFSIVVLFEVNYNVDFIRILNLNVEVGSIYELEFRISTLIHICNFGCIGGNERQWRHCQNWR